MLTKEEKQLKEAIKILVRDGRNGKLFEAAIARYHNLKSDERINNLAHEIGGVDWSDSYKQDIALIESM
jgi:hypothetical protein